MCSLLFIGEFVCAGLCPFINKYDHGPFLTVRWSNKTEQALFFGRDSREECLHMVTLSKKRGRDLGKTNLAGFFDLFKYKYQVNLMLGNSLVLKQNSPNHFYTHLKKPGTHYIPIDDISYCILCNCMIIDGHHYYICINDCC
uniref:Protein O-glucosyltransferase 3 n=1 Tax=Oncorhynchus mykiss TaxID=8022 RepID=A0A8K9Y7H5_ONCMY